MERSFPYTDYGERVHGIAFATDGRLATVSYDGHIRLYDREFKRVVPPRKMTGGTQPRRVAFSPDGTVLAAGYERTKAVDLFDGHSLMPLSSPNVNGLVGINLSTVAWSKDGKTLYAGGRNAGHFFRGPRQAEVSAELCRPEAILSPA
jgi:WD40 repeat protein